MLITELANHWQSAIVNFDSVDSNDDFKFDPLAQSTSALEKIIQDKKLFRFAQFLQAKGAKLFHQYLDDESVSLIERFSLIKMVLNITEEYLKCDFNNINVS